MKSNHVPVRMDDNMLVRLDELVEKMNMRGRSELIREAIELLLKSDQPELTRELIDEFSSWRKELHRVGSNLNQVAYKMNAGHPLSSDQIQSALNDLRPTLKVLATDMKRMRNGLGI